MREDAVEIPATICTTRYPVVVRWILPLRIMMNARQRGAFGAITHVTDELVSINWKVIDWLVEHYGFSASEATILSARMCRKCEAHFMREAGLIAPDKSGECDLCAKEPTDSAPNANGSLPSVERND